LKTADEPWRYDFYCRAPEDYTGFFERIRSKRYAGW
jgi:hypothetical protein